MEPRLSTHANRSSSSGRWVDEMARSFVHLSCQMRGEETGLFAERWRATHQSEAGAAEKSCAFDLAFLEYRQIGRQSANRIVSQRTLICTSHRTARPRRRTRFRQPSRDDQRKPRVGSPFNYRYSFVREKAPIHCNHVTGRFACSCALGSGPLEFELFFSRPFLDFRVQKGESFGIGHNAQVTK
jgi:hypothetical protein